jgi:hypothetical protein
MKSCFRVLLPGKEKKLSTRKKSHNNMITLEEKINELTEGDEVIIYSKSIPAHETQPLPEQGVFLQHRFSESYHHPLWIDIIQERGQRRVMMTFPVSNIESITVLNE